MDTDQLADADFARACELSSDLRELVEKESCTQGKLMDALLLKRNDVHHMQATSARTSIASARAPSSAWQRSRSRSRSTE